MTKRKYNYAVVQSIFGDVWVGETKLPIKPDRIFADVDDAILKAQQLFQDNHMEFDEFAEPEDGNYNDELLSEYERIDEIENMVKIPKGVEKFIV